MPRRATSVKVMRLVEHRLTALLKSPKTRKGLLAATADMGLAPAVINGWISAAAHIGTVCTHRAGPHLMYSLKSAQVDEPTGVSLYPGWLDPRNLPAFSARRIRSSAVPEDLFDDTKDPQKKNKNNAPDPGPELTTKRRAARRN